MTPLDFFKAVWPAAGVYALATPFQIPGTNTRVYAHKVFTDIEAAADYAQAHARRTDLYLAVHTLKERQVWNPNKTNRKTGEKGAFEVRTHQNMCESRAFFFDIDVDADSDGRKYETQGHALAALKQFCVTVALPRPMVVSSGGGLHVYWLVEDPIPSHEWAAHAEDLKQVAQHHGLKIDPARTTDVSSVLRVAGTYNLKDPHNPRAVQVITPTTPLPNHTFLQMLSAARIEAGVAATVAVSSTPAYLNDILGSNLSEEFTGPPVSIKGVATACAQLRRLMVLKGDVSEPEWYHSLNLVRFMENSEKLIHKISEGHPHYSKAATDQKVAQLREKNLGPTSCTKLAEVCGSVLCKACPSYGKVKSPLVAGRFKDPAPAPVVTTMTGATVQTVQVPEPPKPYTRLKSGAIAKTAKNKDGDEITTVIYPNDLYPLTRVSNLEAKTEQQVWRVHLPRSKPKDFTLDADALYDRRKFVTTVSNHGIYPQASNLQDLQDYMVAYIAELQRLADAETQAEHMGWADEFSQFIMPDKIMLRDGSAKPVSLSLGAQRSSADIHKKGTLERQVELLKFYNHPGYVVNQFFILCSLAAPIFHMTGHHGSIVNASGEAGASKSTSLYTAASLWGHPMRMPLNGTDGGATPKARAERVTVLSNLPVCVDEITHMKPQEASALAMGITQPRGRGRLERSGVEQAAPASEKATLMLTTANNSLHNSLSTDNASGTAGSMRVFELLFRAALVHKKYEADEYLSELRQNYGHIAEVFMAYVLQNYPAVTKRVMAKMRKIDEAAGIQSSERFWSAVAAAALVAGEIAKELGLIDFDTEAMYQWLVNEQIPQMRGIVMEEYTDPLGILANYLATIDGDILVVHKPTTQANLSYVSRTPRGPMLGHYDVDDKVLWVLKKGFKDYCLKSGANSTKILDDLNVPRHDRSGKLVKVVPSKNIKKVLGAGTEYAKAQAWCFSVNMEHPEVTGAVEITVAATTSEPATTPAKGKLKPV